MASSTGAAHFFARTSKCLSDPVFADFTIIAADKEYKVNRMLLACHSEYFKKAFETKFKVRRHNDFALIIYTHSATGI